MARPGGYEGRKEKKMNPRSYTVIYNRSTFVWQVWHNNAVVYEATTSDDAEHWASRQG